MSDFLQIYLNFLLIIGDFLAFPARALFVPTSDHTCLTGL